MEIFVDGGLIELGAAISLGYVINYIFLKKYLLILFSAVSVSAPVLMLFINKGEAFYFLATLMVFNAVLLIVLLWKERLKFPGQPLFDIEKLKAMVNTRFFKKHRKKTTS